MREIHEADLDVLLIIGDYVAHDVDPTRSSWTLEGYLKMLENLNTSLGLV